MIKAQIEATAYYLPHNLYSNENYAHDFGLASAEQLFKSTGISKRFYADKDEVSSDIALLAARKLISDHQIDVQQIDYLIFCTQSTDYLTPSTACLLHKKLSLSAACGALDINQGCTGFLYSLSLAKALIESKQAQKVLILTAETISKYLYRKDKATKALFGDGAAACLVSKSEHAGIGNFIFGTDGSGFNIMNIQRGGARHRFDGAHNPIYTDKYGYEADENCFYMDGAGVLGFSLQTVPKLFNDCLQINEMKQNDIDLFIFHQANNFILEKLQNKLNIESDKYFRFVENCGNTVSSTLPICISEARQQAKIKNGMNVMLLAFGVGLSWCGTVVKF